MTEARAIIPKMKTDAVGILELNYPKAARRFAALFPLAEKQLWIKETGSLHVSFLKDGNKVSAVFTLQGTMKYSVDYLLMVKAFKQQDKQQFSF